MVDINRLLKKKGWTGDEIGKALVLSLIDAFKQTLKGVSAPKELFSSEQLKTMVMSLKDRQQGIRYNRYLGLQGWLMQYQAVANAYFQRLQGDITLLLSTYTTAKAVEETSKYIERLPAVMTQKQHDEIKARRIEEQLAGNTNCNAFSLIAQAIEHFEEQLRLEPKKPNPLKAIKKKYQTAPVVTKHILERYTLYAGNGYYSLPDGRRSDQMTSEAWQEAITTPAMKEIMDGDKDKAYPPEIIRERATNRARLIFAGGTEQEADKAQNEADEKKGLSVHCEWHYYDSPPADLCKWEIIEEAWFLEYYPALKGEFTPEAFLEQAQAFKEEFPELVEAVTAEIDKQYFKGFKDIPVKKWLSTTHSWRELYTIGYWGFKERVERDASIFEGNYRAIINGIAILRPRDLLDKNPGIDDRGYYIEPEKRAGLSIGLERYTPANPDYMGEVGRLEETRTNMEESLYWIKGFNTAIELTAEAIGIPEFTIFKINVAHSEARIKALNGLIAMFYAEIKATDYANKEAQQAKLQVLRDFFHPFSEEEIVIPESAIETARALLNDNLKAFEAQDGAFIKILTERAREA